MEYKLLRFKENEVTFNAITLAHGLVSSWNNLDLFYFIFILKCPCGGDKNVEYFTSQMTKFVSAKCDKMWTFMLSFKAR